MEYTYDPPFNVLDVKQLLLVFVLKVLYNIYFRHRGIPTKLEFCWSDFTLSSYTKQGIAHLKIEELHNELGISLETHGLTIRGCGAHPARSCQFQVSKRPGGHLFVSCFHHKVCLLQVRYQTGQLASNSQQPRVNLSSSSPLMRSAIMLNMHLCDAFSALVLIALQ
jgi:hypothetical protein